MYNRVLAKKKKNTVHKIQPTTESSVYWSTMVILLESTDLNDDRTSWSPEFQGYLHMIWILRHPFPRRWHRGRVILFRRPKSACGTKESSNSGSVSDLTMKYFLLPEISFPIKQLLLKVIGIFTISSYFFFFFSLTLSLFLSLPLPLSLPSFLLHFSSDGILASLLDFYIIETRNVPPPVVCTICILYCSIRSVVHYPPATSY